MLRRFVSAPNPGLLTSVLASLLAGLVVLTYATVTERHPLGPHAPASACAHAHDGREHPEVGAGGAGQVVIGRPSEARRAQATPLSNLLAVLPAWMVLPAAPLLGDGQRWIVAADSLSTPRWDGRSSRGSPAPQS